MVGDPVVTFATIERIEGALDLPRDALNLVGAHDWPGLREIGVEPDLVRWVKGTAEDESRTDGEDRRTG